MSERVERQQREGAHFWGGRFHNLDPTPRGVWGMLRNLGFETRGTWGPRRDEPLAPAPPRDVSDGIRVTLIGHATLLVQLDGMNILTDPVWSVAAGPFGLLGPRRHRPAAIALSDLPRVDLVVLSHDHYDHLDVPTLIALRDAHPLRVVTGLGNGALLKRHGLAVTELDWWQSSREARARVTCVPAQHFSGRGLFDRDRTLWAGFVIEAPSGRIFFAGDTGWGGHFAAIRARLGAPDVALLPIGAYRPRAMMGPIHMDPAEAVRAHLALEAGRSIPMHYGTFRLSADGETEPLEALSAALSATGVQPSSFAPLHHGEAAFIRGRSPRATNQETKS